jgi:pfkB family carbohydrate kinase
VAVIVVIGPVVGQRRGPDGVEPAGLTAGVAMAAAVAGNSVEMVTRVGDDPPGDAVVLALARSGVKHVATIRDAGRRTPVLPDETDHVDPGAEARQPDTLAADDGEPPLLDAADVGLALRYLSDYRVIVLIHPKDQAVVAEASAAAGWAGAHLVLVITDDDPDGEVPDGTLVITAHHEAEGVPALLGRYAAAVDRGEDVAAAYAALTGTPSD